MCPSNFKCVHKPELNLQQLQQRRDRTSIQSQIPEDDHRHSRCDFLTSHEEGGVINCTVGDDFLTSHEDGGMINSTVGDDFLTSHEDGGMIVFTAVDDFLNSHEDGRAIN